MDPARQPKRPANVASQRAYWASVGRASFPAICVGALLVIPYVLYGCWAMAGALLALEGSKSLPEMKGGSHPVWSILGAIGVALITGGVSLAVRSRREYQRLEQAGERSPDTDPGEPG